MQRHLLISIIILMANVGCSKKDTLFKEVLPSQSGINFSNTLSNSPELNILTYLYYYNGGGVATADFNQDGLIDIFFTANESSDALYLNQGGLSFKKLEIDFGDFENAGWSTGASLVDINYDGLMDIYICKASGFKNLKGQNQLWVNQGNDSNGLLHFKESAKEYGLDISAMSTQATFFDYDRDGDLDMYLLNHSVYPNRNYGRGGLRAGFHPLYGDRLYENQNDFYVEVSEVAGIFQGQIGYGLGIATGDTNNDGYPDIYIGNDFYENDYFYLNNQNKTFTEQISKNNAFLGHTSHFSMGNAMGDINNDGFLDIISTDMLPENLKTYKTSGLEYAFPIYRQYLNKGYAPQYMQNTLHLSHQGVFFSEVAELSGIAATEWSWCPLLADFDLDGFQDIYVTNGIKGATNDMDYMNFIANEEIQKRIDKGMKKEDLPLTQEIPEKKIANYIFKNQGNATFLDVTKQWSYAQKTFSNGAAYADLDNDGDLDLVVNNVDEHATLLVNNHGGNFIKIRFLGENKNTQGIGAKVWVYTSNNQLQENFPTKGYLSTVAPELLFGLGNDTLIDSLKVWWPSGKIQKLFKVQGNKVITLNERNAELSKTEHPLIQKLYQPVDTLIKYKHQEGVPLDFDRQPLIPFGNSNNGPCIAIADFDKNGLEDVFIGGAKRQNSALFSQKTPKKFEKDFDLFADVVTREEVVTLVFDANNDGWEDLWVGAGGNEFTSGEALQPTLYINTNGKLRASNLFPKFEKNIATAVPIDYDNDGDMDLFVAVDIAPGEYGITPKHKFFVNDGKGKFTQLIDHKVNRLFGDLGNIKAVATTDYNNDGRVDLVLAGHWMPITLLLNTENGFSKVEYTDLSKTHGWWNTVEVADFNQDGILDIAAGNWGLNTKFMASPAEPITLYLADFDSNGTIDPVVTYYHQHQETPFSSKDELVKQMPFLNKDFLSYNKFASASLNDLLGKSNLDKALKKQVYELRSSLFLGKKSGGFEQVPLPLRAQESQINVMLAKDLNGDNKLELITAGNNHVISTQLGKQDACHGKIWWNTGSSIPYQNYQSLYVSGVVNAIEEINIENKQALIIGRNDENIQILLPNED